MASFHCFDCKTSQFKEKTRKIFNPRSFAIEFVTFSSILRKLSEPDSRRLFNSHNSCMVYIGKVSRHRRYDSVYNLQPSFRVCFFILKIETLNKHRKQHFTVSGLSNRRGKIPSWFEIRISEIFSTRFAEKIKLPKMCCLKKNLNTPFSW